MAWRITVGRSTMQNLLAIFAVLSAVLMIPAGIAQLLSPFAQTATKQLKKPPAKAARGTARSYPELVDITASTGIQFEHFSSPEQKFIVESMSGGVALIDYDRDGWPDIYFTNAQSVEMALHGRKARSALNHNRSEEHTSELQSRLHLVCRLLLEKKKTQKRAPNCAAFSRSGWVFRTARCRSRPARPGGASGTSSFGRPRRGHRRGESIHYER